MRFIITAQPPARTAQHPDPNALFDEELFSDATCDSTRKCTGPACSSRPRASSRAAKWRASRSKKGTRGRRDGPVDSPSPKELVGGFYIIEVDSQEEAIRWALRCPSGSGFDDVLEIRALTGESDIPPSLLELAPGSHRHVERDVLEGVA